MKRTIVKLISAMLVICLLFTAIPMSGFANFNLTEFLLDKMFSRTFAEEIVYSGNCGDNVTWTLDNSGILILYGNGAMLDFSNEDGAPWRNYRGLIKTVIIKNGITHIGAQSFFDCINLTKISISDNVIDIGYLAFGNCASLVNVVIPNGVQNLGGAVFSKCTGLLSVVLPNSVKTLGYSCFSGCSNLISVVLPSSLKSLDWFIFDGCRNLIDITIPDSVTSIGYAAFRGCESLNSVHIGKNTESIDSSAFEGCSALSQLIVSEGNHVYHSTNNCIIKTDEKRLIVGGNASEIPNDGSVTSINNSAFSDRSKLKTITVPDSVMAIEEYAFKGCCDLCSVSLGKNLSKIGYHAFEGCKSLISISLPDSITSIDNGVFYNCESLSVVSIGSKLKRISDDAFYNCSSLISITIPNSVESIGETAFWFCSNLKSITIPDSVKSIERAAFVGCSSLKNIVIGKNVASLGSDLFWSCSSIESFIVAEENDVYCSKGNCLIDQKTGTLIAGCKNSEIPADGSIKIIGDYAFDDCIGLVSISIPDGVTKIGKSAFAGCANLKSVSIPNSVTSIESYSFENCSSLSCVSLPNGVKEIGYSVFSGCAELQSIVLPSTVSFLGKGLFEGCINLMQITVESGNTVYYSKNNCVISTDSKTLVAGCKNSVIPDDGSVLKIGDSAFYSTGITSVVIPNSIINIGKYAFSQCDSLESVSIGNSVTAIEQYAFRGCKSLNSVTIPANVTKIGVFGFADTGLESVTVLGHIEMLESGVFRGCEKLRTVKLNSSIKRFNNSHENHDVVHHNWGCFSGCKSLERIVLPDEIENIACATFYDCSSLTEIVLPSNVTIISSMAFMGCKNLDFITISSGVSSIGREAFSDCTNLKNVFFQGSSSKWEGIIIGIQNAPLLNANLHFAGYSIHYNANGGNNAPLTQNKAENESITLRTTIPLKSYTVSFNANGGSVSSESKSVNCTFKNWNTAVDGSGISYNPGGTYTENADATLYAQWENPTAGALATPTRSGYTFTGWYTAVTGGTQITVSSTITGNISLYAHWNTAPIDPKPTDFTWGEDNWNFNNSSATGDFSSGTYRSQINNTYLNVLKNNLTNSEYQTVFVKYGTYSAWLDEKWGGSCYGMSSTSLLSKNGYLPFAQYKNGATKLNDLNKPTADSGVSSLVTYYQMLQVKSVIQQQYRTVPYRTNETNIKQIISLLDENPTVLVGFKKSGWGGHAILAYAYEYGNYTYNGVSYQGCIKICDPNASKAYDPSCNIYFNTKTYQWAIPFYSNYNISSARGAVFNYIGANLDEINQGGYLSGASKKSIEGYVARIDAFAIGDTRTVSKVQQNGANYMMMNTAPGDIIEDYSYILGNESVGTIGYNLMDGDAAYMISQTDPVNMELVMDYENCEFGASSAAGKRIIFDKNGYVEVSGESSMFTLTMTFDEDYPTDWFSIQAQGNGSDYASLKKTKEGYVLTSDVMHNVTITANNRETTAKTVFSAEYPSVLIYEINQNTIGVKADADGNGTYETVVITASSVMTGDVDNDGNITAADARLALRCAVNLESYAFGSREFLACDVDHNGSVTAADARLILRAAVGLEELDLS